MTFNLQFRISLLTSLIPILLLSLPLPLYAANCDKKPDHPDCVDPPPDDGGNDTADRLPRKYTGHFGKSSQ